MSSAPPPAPTDSPQSVAPYLSAALTILSTLEKEVRVAATPGSSYEVASNALAVRCTELRSQLTRIEFEKRNEALLEQLDGNHMHRSTPGSSGRLPPLRRDPAAVKQIATLTGKLAQAEADCKAYKSRLVKFPRKKGQEWDDDMRSAVQATDPNVLPLPADKNSTEVRAITAEDKAPVYAKLRVERMNARVAGARKKAKEDAAAEKK